MPWRLFLTLLLCTLLIAFVGLNLDNRASISFGFYIFNDVPVFVSMFISFFCGALVMLPFTFGRRKKNKLKDDTKKTKQKSVSESKAAIEAPSEASESAGPQKKKWFRKKTEESAVGMNDSADETAD